MAKDYSFPEICLLVTHFNRSSSLERLLLKFEEINCSFGEIVVSDDCSKDFHQNRLIELSKKFDFKIVFAEKNEGLAANLNKGQKEVSKPFTLYVEEDFIPSGKVPQALETASKIILETSADIVRFSSNTLYPYLTPSVYEGFSEMNFKLFSKGYGKFYMYSDHPHLRRSDFLKKFGEYPTGMPGDKAEYQFMIRFLQHKGKAFFYNEYKSLFAHENPESEPSTMQRSYLSTTNNPIITLIRHLYRHIKFNYNYLFSYKSYRRNI